MTGRSGAVCPGGRAMAQLVVTPPRAAETNEPVTIVGAAAAAGAGSSGAGGSSGAPDGRDIATGVCGGWSRVDQSPGGEGTRGACDGSDAQSQNGATAQVRHAGTSCHRGQIQPSAQVKARLMIR